MHARAGGKAGAAIFAPHLVSIRLRQLSTNPHSPDYTNHVGEGSTDQPYRLTVGQAADQLGISKNAVRNRIKRGTLRHERECGQVFVILAAANQPANNTGQSTGQQAISDQEDPDPRDELIAVLREQLAAEREAHAETRRIAAMLAGHGRELELSESYEEPSQDENRSEEEDAPTDSAADPHSATEEPPEVKRSWWRRLLGG